MTSKRLLVIKLKQPGDVLVSTPVIAALKEAWPNCHLTYLVPKGTEDMVAGHPGLDDLMVVDRRGETWSQALRFARDLRRRRFDLVIELSGGDRGAIYSWLTGAKERLGFARPGMPFWQRRVLYPPAAPAAGQDAPGGPKPGSPCGPWVSSPKTRGSSFFGIRPWKSVSRTCSPLINWPPAASWSCTPGPAGASNAGPPRATPGFWRLCKMTGGCP